MRDVIAAGWMYLRSEGEANDMQVFVSELEVGLI